MLDATREQPPFDIVRVAHIELVVTDLERARTFWVDLIGLEITEEADDALYLRGYEERLHHSLVLRRGATPMMGHAAFRVAAPEHLDLAAAAFADWGCPVARLAPGEVERGQGAAVRVQDPLGFPIELFYDMEHAECLLQEYDRHRGVQPRRFDHVNFYVPDAMAAYEHYRRLGFGLSEYIETDGTQRLAAAWLFRKQTVHDVALTSGRGPRLHHLAYTTANAGTILQLCDRLAAAGWIDAIERGPGRHGVSNAFYLYLRDPDGHRIEFYEGDYYTGDPDHQPIRWSASDPRRRSLWGHAVPDRWYEEGTLVAGPDGVETMALTDSVVDERVPVS
jgi:3,4-dihydroxyphenylacetate 2,3-dioxygenase